MNGRTLTDYMCVGIDMAPLTETTQEAAFVKECVRTFELRPTR